MSRSALSLALALFLFPACASTRTLDLVDDDWSAPPASAPEAAAAPLAAPAEHLGGASPILALEPGPASPALDPAYTKLPAFAEGESLHSNRFTVKAGYYGSSEDALDDGYIVNVAWTRFLNKMFAVELELGYLDVDGSDAGVDTDVWSVPIMLNGRIGLPVWILEVYGGLGVGTFYYDAEASGAVSADDDGFLFGGDAFLGATFNLADALALGLEAKYYVTDDISDVDTGLDAFALMLTLGFSR